MLWLKDFTNATLKMEDLAVEVHLLKLVTPIIIKV